MGVFNFRIGIFNFHQFHTIHQVMWFSSYVVCIVFKAAQEKALSYRDEEVQQATIDINMRHAQMSRSEATRELRMHEPNVHIESEVHVLRAKAMLNMADDQRRDQEHRVVGKTVPSRKDPPTFTKPLLNARAKEGHAVK